VKAKQGFLLKIKKSDFLRSRTIQASLITGVAAIIAAVFASILLAPKDDEQSSPVPPKIKTVSPPKLAAFGFYMDGPMKDAGSEPYIASFFEERPSTSDVYFQDVWDNLKLREAYGADDGRSLYRHHHTLLPGILVFVLQNISGSETPKIVIRNLGLRVDLEPGFAPLGERAVVVVHNHMPAAGFETPLLRGLAVLKRARKVHPVRLPQVNSTAWREIFSYSLEPGEESFYAIELDVDAEGTHDFKIDLLVDAYYVTPEGTRKLLVVVPELLVARALKPPISKVSRIFYNLAGDPEPFKERPDIKPEDVWGDTYPTFAADGWRRR